MIRFDGDSADALIAAATAASSLLRDQGWGRRGAAEHAMEDFSGGFATLFTHACVMESEDRIGLARVLDDLVGQVRTAKAKAADEKARHQAHTAWQEREDARERTHVLLSATGAPPIGPIPVDPEPRSTPFAPPAIHAAFQARHRNRSTVARPGGRTSADPARLRSFTANGRAADAALDAELGRLRNTWNAFAASCDWVRFETTSFLSGFEHLLRENADDALWLNTIADAFEHAGSGSLSDFAIAISWTTTTDPRSTKAAVDGMGPEQLQALLTDLTPERLAALIAAHPALVQTFWNQPPDAETVATWWQSLDPEVQGLYVATVPTVIGNLGGIPYSQRDAANRLAYADARKRYDQLTAEQRATLDRLEGALKHEGVDSAVPIQLIDFNLTAATPLVAVSIGDLDAADTTTWCVPGMNFSAKDATDGWTLAAKNLYNTQRKLDLSRSHAVVAWLGYETPDVFGVLSGDAASAGANRLASELDANHDTRAASGPVPSITVVGHSYGTTTAADALARTTHPVDAFVMVGSAGIDTRYVPDLTELHVGETNGTPAIYSTTAADDLLAPFGAQLSGRAAPNPEAAHLSAPVVGGAQSFSSDGGEGTGLKRVKGHNPLGEGAATTELFNASPPEGNGYFDRNTQSLRNIAATTLGMPAMVDGRLTSTDNAAHAREQLHRDVIDSLYRNGTR